METLLLQLLSLAALIVALYAVGRAATAAQRADELQAQLRELRRRLDAIAGTEPPAHPAPVARAAAPEGPAAGPAGPVRAPGRAPSPPVIPAPPPVAPAPPRAAASPGEGPARAGLEEKLGARLPIWLGSIALALAGAFLVKYTFDRGLLSPAVRVALGVVFGVALLALGEILRRSSGRIAQGLSAAGIADLYACFLAAANLYGLVSPVTGFALLALNTAVAVGLALRQGMIVAVIGLVGGFLTPALLHTEEPRPQLVFLYLLLLQAGLLAVTRRRRWPALGAFSVIAGLVWVVAWLGGPFRPEHAPLLGGFVVSSVLVAVTAGRWRQADAAWGGASAAGALTAIGVGGGVIAMGAVTVAGSYATLEWAFLGLLFLGTLLLGRLDARFEPLAWLAAAAVGILLLLWSVQIEPADGARFLWTVATLGALLAGASYAAIFGAPHPGRWAWLSAVSGVAALLIAYSASRRFEPSVPWGAVALVLAGIELAAALPLARRRQRLGDDALAALAVAVTACVSLAVPMELERQWLSVAWAVEVALLVWLAGRLAVPVLRTLAWLLAAAVAVRLLLNPEVLSYPIGETPILNWLLYGYGLPLAAFAAAAALASRQGRQADERLSAALQWGAIALALALLALEVRHYFHPLDLRQGSVQFVEWGALSVSWMLLGAALLRAARRWRLASLDLGGTVAVSLAGLVALAGQSLTGNPLFEHAWVGRTPILNHLLWVYGLPAAGLALAGAEAERHGARGIPRAWRLGTLLLVFLLVTLEVRQLFHGGYLDEGGAGGAEQYAYSAAWILLGTLLLLVGIARRGREVRLSALAVMLVAVLKVFLYDMAELRDLYRVFSFLGLGVSLLLLAWLYQRFVFRAEAA